jgi:cell division protein FtsQ
VKRPGPLPPQPARRPDPIEDPAPDDVDEPGRARRAPLLPFGRRRPAEADPGDRIDVDDVDTGDEAAGDETDARHAARPLTEWRARRRQKRAERAEVRRFTERSRRRRAAWLGSIGAIVLLAVGTIGAAYSPLFAVQTIEVQGVTTLDPTRVQTALEGQTGRALPLIDRDEIRAKLTSFPEIETYTVQSRPPHTIVVTIVERTPVAAVATEAGYTTVDAAGVALATSEAQPEGLPLAEVDAGAPGRPEKPRQPDPGEQSRGRDLRADGRRRRERDLGEPRRHRGEGPCSHRGLHGDPARHGVELRRVVVGRAGRDGVTTRDFF